MTPTNTAHCGAHNRVLDPAGAAAFLGISDRHLFDVRKVDKTFPTPRMVGTLPRWTESSLLAWIEKPSLQSTAVANGQDSQVDESPAAETEQGPAKRKGKSTDV